MKRIDFLSGFWALLGIGQLSKGVTGIGVGNVGITPGGGCPGPDGHGHPCESLKEGEERCPLGHAQKPNATLWAVPVDKNDYNHQLQMLMEYVGPWIVPKVCSVCGIVYVKQP